MIEILLVVILLIVIWLTSSKIIDGVTKLSIKAKLPTFLVSFVLLGILTSTTEISLAVNSHIHKIPQISVGNLLGGIIVLFLLVIPVLAVFGNGIKVDNNYSNTELLFTLGIICLPAVLFLDGKINKIESVLLMLGYLVPVLILVIRHHDLPAKRGRIPNSIKNTWVVYELIKVCIAGGILLFASDKLIDFVVDFANIFNVTPFIISLLTLSIGTNLPELVLVIRAVLSGEKDLALGNYIGSALMNIFILGVLTMLNPSLVIFSSFWKILLFTFLGLTLFFVFCYTKKELSRREGMLMISVYVIFLISEIVTF